MAMSFSSCATLFSKKQTVIVNSDVDGAKVYKGRKYVGMTPLKFKTKAAKSTFTVSKEGYPTQKIYANVDIRWNTLWNVFNGFYLWPIDLLTGASQKYKTLSYDVSLKNPEKNKIYDKYNRELIVQQYLQQYQQEQQANQGNGGEIAMAIMGGVLEGLAQSEQMKAEKKLLEAERQAQIRAEQQARAAQNKQKYAEFQTMTNKTYSSNYQTNLSSYRTQGSYNDLLTSDPNWNTQVQMWVQQYGVEKTREIVKRQRASNYQQSIQSSRSNSYNQSMSNSYNQSMSERIISAVTSNRQQLNIKVRGNSVVAYGIGSDQFGRKKWTSLFPPAGISRTGVGITGNSSTEFSYTANINGTQIYFDM